MKISTDFYAKEFFTWFAIGAAVVCIGWMFENPITEDPAYLQIVKERDSLAYAAHQWEIKDRFRNDFVDEFKAHIAEIKKHGHHPDSSLVFTQMVEFLQWPNMTWEDMDSMYRRESGWGRDKRKGVFGEIKFSMVDTNTFKEALDDLGFEIVGIRMEDYHNVVSAAEMGTLYTMRVKLLRDGRPDQVVYFNGFYTKLKKFNTARFDSVMAKRKKKKW